MELSQLIADQRRFFHSGKTRSLAFRELMLDDLARKIREMEPEIHAALASDLGKSAFESYMCETGMVLSEIRYMKRHFRKFAARQRVRTPLAQFPSRSYVLKEPYGCVLIMSPWNYPVMLTLEPLVDAIAQMVDLPIAPVRELPGGVRESAWVFAKAVGCALQNGGERA